MNKAFEKILEKLEELQNYACFPTEWVNEEQSKIHLYYANKLTEILKLTEQYNNGWILCSERMPEVETEVLILAKRKYKDRDSSYITTIAMYEDGTVLENDSCWYWENMDGEWDEENECYIIPEGWWECRHCNTDDVYNNTVDDEIIAWQPLPEPYKEREQNE